MMSMMTKWNPLHLVATIDNGVYDAEEEKTHRDSVFRLSDHTVPAFRLLSPATHDSTHRVFDKIE